MQGLGLTKGCKGAQLCGAGPPAEEDLAASQGAVLGGGLPHRDQSALWLKGAAARERGVAPLPCTVAVPGGLRPA